MQRIKNTIFVIDKSSTIKTCNISHFEDEAKNRVYRPQPFDVNHHLVGGLIALGFRADCIKIVVSIATDSSHKLTMGKTKKNILL